MIEHEKIQAVSPLIGLASSLFATADLSGTDTAIAEFRDTLSAPNPDYTDEGNELIRRFFESAAEQLTEFSPTGTPIITPEVWIFDVVFPMLGVNTKAYREESKKLNEVDPDTLDKAKEEDIK